LCSLLVFVARAGFLLAEFAFEGVVAALEALRRAFEGAAGQGTGLGAEEGTPADGQGDGDCQENCQREERSPINSHLPSRFTVASAL